MSTRHTTAPTEAVGHMPALQTMANGLAREAEALDASLDRAFGALRATRALVARMVNPDLPPQGGDSRSAAESPEAIARRLSGALNQIADEINAGIDAAGAAPSADAGVRQTLKVLFEVTAELSVETAMLDLTRFSDPEATEELLELCQSEAIALQRRLSAPIGKLMSIMQLRDNIDQRSSHVVACAGLAETSDAAAVRVIELFLKAQVADMSLSVSEGEASVRKAVDTILSATGKAQSEISLAVGRVLLPRSAKLLSQALQLQDTWGRCGSLSDHGDLVSRFVSGAWTEAVTALLRSDVAPATPFAEVAGRIAQMIGFIGQTILNVSEIKKETEALANSALMLDGLADGLANSLSVSCLSVDGHSQVLDQLWNSYTVDAERHVHENLLLRLRC